MPPKTTTLGGSIIAREVGTSRRPENPRLLFDLPVATVLRSAICMVSGEPVFMRRSPTRHPVLGGALVALITVGTTSLGAVQGEKKQPAKLEESQRKDAQALIGI